MLTQTDYTQTTENAIEQLAALPVAGQDQAEALSLADKVGLAWLPQCACPVVGAQEYIDGGLDDDFLAEHAVTCPMCQELVTRIAEVIAQVRAAHNLTGYEDDFAAMGLERWDVRESRERANDK